VSSAKSNVYNRVAVEKWWWGYVRLDPIDQHEREQRYREDNVDVVELPALPRAARHAGKVAQERVAEDECAVGETRDVEYDLVSRAFVNANETWVSEIIS
jgi:hypothetical protein